MSSRPGVDWLRPLPFTDVERAARFAIEEIDTTVINGQLNGLSSLEGGSELDTRGHQRPLVVSKQASILSRRSCCPRLC
jgi:hypothetical protein